MDAKPAAPDPDKPVGEPPAPETLQTQEDAAANPAAGTDSKTETGASGGPPRLRRAYRPSHKGTFIGLAVVVVILVANAGAIGFLIKKQQAKTGGQANQAQVTISQGALDKLGVNRSAVGNAGVELTVNPDANFKGKLQVSGDVNVAGQLKLNSKFSASDASLTKLQAGDVAVNKIDVNGDGTVSNFNLRKDLAVAGATRLQGPATFSQLVTINNNLNVSGSLAVGGSLSVNNFHASSLTVDTAVTLGGHIITRGSAPGIGPGAALGSNGTVSISGNDAAGTIAANIGVGAASGTIANIAFKAQYGTIPHVVVTPVGAGNGGVYITRTVGGFSIGVNNALAPGGYAFDYIVAQ